MQDKAVALLELTVSWSIGLRDLGEHVVIAGTKLLESFSKVVFSDADIVLESPDWQETRT